MAFTKQPQYCAPLDRGNPAAQGASVVVSYGAGSLNAVTNRWPDLQIGIMSRNVGEFGKYDNAYSGGTGTADDRYSFPPTSDFALLAVVDYSASPGVVSGILGGDGSGNRQFQFRFNASNQLEFIRFDTSGSPYFATVAASSRKGVVLAISVGASMRVYFREGTGTGTISNTPMAASRVSLGGSFGFDVEQGVNDRIYMGCVLRGSVCEKMAPSLLFNPWQIFAVPVHHSYIGFTSSSTDTPVNPGAGAITVAGFAPTVAQTANQGITPGVGGVAIAGYAPAIAQTANQAISPANGAITVAGYAPTVEQASPSPTIEPGTGSMTIVGYAPTVSQTGQQASGGFFEIPQVRRHRSVKEDRERMGIIPREIKQIVKSVARATVVAEKTDMQAQSILASRLEQQDIESKAKYAEFMRQERDRLRTQAIARAMQIQRRKKQLEDEEDDHDAVMLLMS
jgi:hypothetical protein